MFAAGFLGGIFEAANEISNGIWESLFKRLKPTRRLANLASDGLTRSFLKAGTLTAISPIVAGFGSLVIGTIDALRDALNGNLSEMNDTLSRFDAWLQRVGQSFQSNVLMPLSTNFLFALADGSTSVFMTFFINAFGTGLVRGGYLSL